MRKFCELAPSSRRLLEHAVSRLGLSARGYDRVLKVSRTIADLAGAERIDSSRKSISTASPMVVSGKVGRALSTCAPDRRGSGSAILIALLQKSLCSISADPLWIDGFSTHSLIACSRPSSRLSLSAFGLRIVTLALCGSPPSFGRCRARPRKNARRRAEAGAAVSVADASGHRAIPWALSFARTCAPAVEPPKTSSGKRAPQECS